MNSTNKSGWRYLSLAFIFAFFTPLFANVEATESSPLIAVPDTPVLLTPLNGADNVPETVPLRWAPVDGADRYNVQVATDQAFTSIVFAINVPKAPVTFSAPIPNTTYFWRVQASNDDGMSSFSSPYVFHTKDVAEEDCAVVSPQLLTPLNNSFGHPDSVLLRWEAVDGAERYNVQVALNNEFNDPVFDANVPESPVWFFAPFSDTTYFWHVQSVGPDELCDYGDTWTFSTGTKEPREVAPPKLLTPLNGAMNVPNNVNLRFERLGDEFRFNVQVAADKAFSAIMFSMNVPQSPVPFNAPTPGMTYFWRVQAVDDAGNMSKFSAPFVFTTESEEEAEFADSDETSSSSKTPTEFALGDNYPDPFNPTTTITVDIPEATNMKVAVYDMLGQEVMQVASGSVEAGTHSYTVDASGLSSGMYLYRIETPEFSATKRLVLMK